ncbi:hypothetical protein SETIT_5G150300v2 [Setaria italica]|uniref:GDSL esterase/lipase n=1 Tax=Setaria italica TaxID=4555 RepID=A0A368R4W9_SETIT|nr:hypothetical protein SETIT_5G150300v2 [Setaria italica]
MKRISLCLQITVLLSSLSSSMQTQYTFIFSFAIISGPATPNLWITKPPYGMTFFGHPTGHLSAGRLIKLINEGATMIIVSGISPLSQDKADYEPDTGCLRTLNLLSKSHNSQLREAVARLGSRHPGARITYADLYAPLIGFAAALARYRFDGADGALRACCGGGGGRYNFNLSAACGMPGVSACARLSAYVNWDGVHLTEAAYRRVTDGWLRGP